MIQSLRRLWPGCAGYSYTHSHSPFYLRIPLGNSWPNEHVPSIYQTLEQLAHPATPLTRTLFIYLYLEQT